MKEVAFTGGWKGCVSLLMCERQWWDSNRARFLNAVLSEMFRCVK